MLVMKKILFILILLIVETHSFCQITFLADDAKNSEKLFAKSERQKKNALLFIAVGSIAIAVGIPLLNSSTNLDVALLGLTLSMYGGGFVTTGILLFRSSARNKKRAIKLAVSNVNINSQFIPNITQKLKVYLY